MTFEYCLHDVPVDEQCDACDEAEEALGLEFPPPIKRTFHVYTAEQARAWAGLAMWLECYWPGRDLTDNAWCQGWRAAHEHVHQWEEGWTNGEQLRCRAWQALRDWLDGTAEQWRVRVVVAAIGRAIAQEDDDA